MHWKVLTVAVSFVVMAVAAPAAHAAGLSRDLRFFGRWDRRQADRAITVNSGSYVLAKFQGSTLNALFDVSQNQPPFPTVTWQIDQGDWQEAEVAPTVKLADGLPAGSHTLMLMVRGLDEHQSRWNPPLIASLTFLGLEFPEDGKTQRPPREWDHPKLKIEFLGDSITEGVLVQDEREGKKTWPWRTDARNNYAGRTAVLLGASWRQVGFGATGLAHGGSGGAPGALDSFNFIYAGVPRDNWQPDLVVINQGTNDGGMPSDQYRPLYEKYLEMIRQAYPHAKIAAVQPFNGAQGESIRAEVDARRDAGDKDVYFVDTTGWYPTGPLHPNAAGSGPLAEKLAAALQEILRAK